MISGGAALAALTAFGRWLFRRPAPHPPHPPPPETADDWDRLVTRMNEQLTRALSEVEYWQGRLDAVRAEMQAKDRECARQLTALREQNAIQAEQIADLSRRLERFERNGAV